MKFTEWSHPYSKKGVSEAKEALLEASRRFNWGVQETPWGTIPARSNVIRWAGVLYALRCLGDVFEAGTVYEGDILPESVNVLIKSPTSTSDMLLTWIKEANKALLFVDQTNFIEKGSAFALVVLNGTKYELYKHDNKVFSRRYK